MANSFIDQVKEAKAEAKRFLKRCDELEKRIKNDKFVNRDGSMTSEAGAVKRAALDLKLELTNITQFGNYERNKERGR